MKILKVKYILRKKNFNQKLLLFCYEKLFLSFFFRLQNFRGDKLPTEKNFFRNNFRISKQEYCPNRVVIIIYLQGVDEPEADASDLFILNV